MQPDTHARTPAALPSDLRADRYARRFNAERRSRLQASADARERQEWEEYAREVTRDRNAHGASYGARG